MSAPTTCRHPDSVQGRCVACGVPYEVWPRELPRDGLMVDGLLASAEPNCDWRVVTRLSASEVHGSPCPRKAERVLRSYCGCGGVQVDLICREHALRVPLAAVFCRECGEIGRPRSRSVEIWPQP